VGNRRIINVKIDSKVACCVNCKYGSNTHDDTYWYCQKHRKAVFLKLNCPFYVKKTKNKYGSKITEVDKIKFHSKKEAQRYQELKMLQKAGEILYFLRQPMFDLGGGTTYRADFLVVEKNNHVMQIEDVKGYITKEFKRIKKIVESIYPVEIKIIK
jgi:dsDNA-binding SOS-regulon protein